MLTLLPRHRLELMRQIYNGGGDDMLLDSPHGGSTVAQDSVFSCLESLAPGGGRGSSSNSGAARWVQLPADMCVTPLYRLADKELTHLITHMTRAMRGKTISIQFNHFLLFSIDKFSEFLLIKLFNSLSLA